MARSLTAANAVIAISFATIFPTPIQLQGFAADDVFTTELVDSAEVLMGVDGNLSFGFVFVPIKWAISLQSDSDSCDVFDQVWAAQQTAQDIYPANAIVTLPAVSKKWNLVKGIITSMPPMPDVKKIIQPRKYGMTWNFIRPSPTA